MTVLSPDLFPVQTSVGKLFNRRSVRKREARERFPSRKASFPRLLRGNNAWRRAVLLTTGHTFIVRDAIIQVLEDGQLAGYAGDV
jgi:hypothetical protein